MPHAFQAQCNSSKLQAWRPTGRAGPGRQRAGPGRYSTYSKRAGPGRAEPQTGRAGPGRQIPARAGLYYGQTATLEKILERLVDKD